MGQKRHAQARLAYQAVFGNNVSAYQIPPLPNIPFPPLPVILDVEIRKVVTTHASMRTDTRGTHDMYPISPLMDYEKLEHVGDALLSAVVVVILHDEFPNMGEGIATMIKGQLVSNVSLAQISERYGLNRLLKVAPGSTHTVPYQVKTKASIFEAWIAGVYYTTLNEAKSATSIPSSPEKSQLIDARTRDEPECATAASRADRKNEKSTDSPFERSEPPSDADAQSSGGQITKREDNGGSTHTAEGESRPTLKDDTKEEVHDTCDSATRCEEPESGPSPRSESKQKHLATRSECISPSSPTTPRSATTQSPPILPSPSSDPRSDPLLESATADFHRLRWLAMCHLDDWLRPLFTPLAHWALAELRAEQKRQAAIRAAALVNPVTSKSAEEDAEDKLACGANGVLHHHSQAEKVETPRFRESCANDEWTMVCMMWDKNGIEHTASATRPTKKAAKALAAYRVADQMGLIKGHSTSAYVAQASAEVPRIGEGSD